MGRDNDRDTGSIAATSTVFVSAGRQSLRLRRPGFGLFHGDLVDVAQRLSSGSPFDRLDRNVLDLFLRFFELRLKLFHLSGLTIERILQ